MSEATYPTRLVTAQQFVMHIGHRDLDRGVELLAPNVTYRIPGNHLLAGVLSGREQVTRHFIDLAERTTGTFDALKWDDWMLGTNHVTALATIQFQMSGQVYTGRVLFLMRFDIEDKIAEIVTFLEDERSVERILASFPGEAAED